MATQKLSFCKFKPIKEINLEEYAEKLMSYSNGASKFVVNDCTAFWLDGYFVVEYTKNETRYNFLETKVEVVPVTVAHIAKFSIDLKNSLLDIWGNKATALKLITVLSTLMSNQVVIESLSSDINKIIGLAQEENEITISKVKIEDVIIDNGIVANCSIDLSGHVDYEFFLSKYAKNIMQATMVVFADEPDHKVSFTIFSSGSLVIYKDKDDIDDSALEIITRVCCPQGRGK